MNQIYGYARCSTNESKQDINRQKRELFELGVQEDKYIYWEYESGSNVNRAEFKKLLDIVEEKDTIVCTEVSRLTRSTKHLCEVLQMVQERHIRLIIGNFIVDCRNEEIDPMTKGMLMMWGVFSEMEKDMISQRVKSGMKNARAKGKSIGRPVITTDNIPSTFLKYYPKYKRREMNVTEISRLCEMSRTTIYKYIALIEQ